MTDLMQRLENYLAAGGLVNPELMDHERVRDLIIDCRDALAQPEQASAEPPDYVEPPTSDYHNGWEEGFEVAKNLYPKQTKREWVGLTDMDIHVLKMNHDKVKVVYTDRAEDLTVLGQDVDVNGLINAIQTKLKELNT